jgi:hypothetical protein
MLPWCLSWIDKEIKRLILLIFLRIQHLPGYPSGYCFRKDHEISRVARRWETAGESPPSQCWVDMGTHPLQGKSWNEHVHTYVRTYKSRKRAEKERERDIYDCKEIERYVAAEEERRERKSGARNVYKGIRNGESSGAAATSKRPPTGRTSSGLSARVPAGACTCPWENRVDRASSSMSRCAAPTPRCFDSGWTGVARCAPGRGRARARTRACACVRSHDFRGSRWSSRYTPREGIMSQHPSEHCGTTVSPRLPGTIEVVPFIGNLCSTRVSPE